MKLMESLKSNKTKAHFIALLIYIIGFICDAYGYLNVGIEALGYIFLIGFVCFGGALIIIWDINNKRCLKAARVSFTFLLIGLPTIFITWFQKLYPTFAFTIIFILIVAVVFIESLYKICEAYYYDDWK